MSIDGRLRWAVIGTGRIAARFTNDMQYSRLGRIAAIGSRNIEKGRRFSEPLGSDIVVDTFPNILMRDDVDAVYLATSNEVHAEQALQAIAAGKPVLIEKPIASNARDAARIETASRQTNILAMEAMWMRFTPGIARLKSLVTNGDLGDVKRIVASIAFAHVYDDDLPLFSPDHGGALLDLGVYPVSLAVYIAGPVSEVSSMQLQQRNGSTFAATVSLRHGDVLSSLNCGFDVEGPNDASVFGTRGIATTAKSMLCPTAIAFRTINVPNRNMATSSLRVRSKAPLLTKLGSLRSLASSIKTRPKLTFFEGSALHYQADHFAACLRDGLKLSPVMPLQDSVEVIRIIDKAKTSC